MNSPTKNTALRVVQPEQCKTADRTWTRDSVTRARRLRVRPCIQPQRHARRASVFEQRRSSSTRNKLPRSRISTAPRRPVFPTQRPEFLISAPRFSISVAPNFNPSAPNFNLRRSEFPYPSPRISILGAPKFRPNTPKTCPNTPNFRPNTPNFQMKNPNFRPPARRLP